MDSVEKNACEKKRIFGEEVHHSTTMQPQPLSQ